MVDGNFPYGDTSTWSGAVDRMKSWYESNIHTYQKLWSVGCPLINGNVRDDCSGFVNACLCLYGLPTYNTSSGTNAPASYYMMQDSYAEKLSSSFIRIPYSKENLQPYDIIVGNAVNGNQHGHTEIYAGDRKSFSWGRVHDLATGGMPSPTAWSFNGGTTYSYIFRCNGSGSIYASDGTNLTKDQLVEELADRCPKEIEFKGLWMRYHLFAGNRSPIIKEIMNAHATSSQFYGDTSSVAGDAHAILTSGQQRANAERIIFILMQRLGLTRQQAAGITGVGMAESGCDPHNYNRAEKAGIYKRSAANGAGYGAGIWQWSMGRKVQALKLIGSPGPIESLSLEDQCEMLARELEGPYKPTLEGIKKCSDAATAAATFYCHSIAGYSRSTEPATKAEIDRDNARYAAVGGNSQINKGMNYALGLI